MAPVQERNRMVTEGGAVLEVEGKPAAFEAAVGRWKLKGRRYS